MFITNSGKKNCLKDLVLPKKAERGLKSLFEKRYSFVRSITGEYAYGNQLCHDFLYAISEYLPSYDDVYKLFCDTYYLSKEKLGYFDIVEDVWSSGIPKCKYYVYLDEYEQYKYRWLLNHKHSMGELIEGIKNEAKEKFLNHPEAVKDELSFNIAFHASVEKPPLMFDHSCWDTYEDWKNQLERGIELDNFGNRWRWVKVTFVEENGLSEQIARTSELWKTPGFRSLNKAKDYVEEHSYLKVKSIEWCRDCRQMGVKTH